MYFLFQIRHIFIDQNLIQGIAYADALFAVEDDADSHFEITVFVNEQKIVASSAYNHRSGSIFLDECNQFFATSRNNQINPIGIVFD